MEWITRTVFASEERGVLIRDVEYLIKIEKDLSSRTPMEISRAIDARHFVGLFDGARLIGFIFLVPLSKKTTELNGLYLRPEFRGMGVSDRLIRDVTDQPGHRYFGAFFVDRSRRLLERCGFVDSSLRELSLAERIRFLSSRISWHRLRDIGRHAADKPLQCMMKSNA